MATLTTTIVSTPSTTVYTLPMADLSPIGKLTEQDFEIISDINWDSSGRGFYIRNSHSFTFEVGEDTLTVGVSQRGKRMTY